MKSKLLMFLILIIFNLKTIYNIPFVESYSILIAYVSFKNHSPISQNYLVYLFYLYQYFFIKYNRFFFLFYLKKKFEIDYYLLQKFFINILYALVNTLI